MTLQLLHSEFPYIWGKFYFLLYQCTLGICTMHMQATAPSLQYSVLYGIISKRRCILPRNCSLKKNHMPRVGTDSNIPIACLVALWNSYGGSWKWVTILPFLWDCQAVVCYLFLYSFICAPIQLQFHMCTNNYNLYRCVYIKLHWKTFHPFNPPLFSPLICPPYRIKGSPEYIPWNVLYHTSQKFIHLSAFKPPLFYPSS